VDHMRERQMKGGRQIVEKDEHTAGELFFSVKR
jgi:hypothetical protein